MEHLGNTNCPLLKRKNLFLLVMEEESIIAKTNKMRREYSIQRHQYLRGKLTSNCAWST